MKIFKFEHNDGAEIIAANNAKEAIMFYFTKYQDDIATDDAVEYGGIKVEELKDESINKKRKVFNEKKMRSDEMSYKELAEEEFKDEPIILVTPYC